MHARACTTPQVMGGLSTIDNGGGADGGGGGKAAAAAMIPTAGGTAAGAFVFVLCCSEPVRGLHASLHIGCNIHAVTLLCSYACGAFIREQGIPPIRRPPISNIISNNNNNPSGWAAVAAWLRPPLRPIPWQPLRTLWVCQWYWWFEWECG